MYIKQVLYIFGKSMNMLFFLVYDLSYVLVTLVSSPPKITAKP